MQQDVELVKNPQLLNPLTLAFIGDSAYEIMVRQRIIEKYGSLSANKLHKIAVGYVQATAQAMGYDRIEGELTENEKAIMKRGRNANTTRCPKNADVIAYRKATGVETLFGYLYLSAQYQRMQTLFEVIVDCIDNTNF